MTIVADGYDAMAERYLRWSLACDWPGRRLFLGHLLDLLEPGSDVLELGCGAGVPVTRALADQHRVTAVAAFYSLTHVGRDQHAALFARIASWLRPGGALVASLGSSDSPDHVEHDWLGAPMFFSHFDGDTSLGLLSGAGFDLERAERVPQIEHGHEGEFLWVVARRR